MCRPARHGAKEDSQGWKELEEWKSSEFKSRQVSGIGNTALGPRREQIPAWIKSKSLA